MKGVPPLRPLALTVLALVALAALSDGARPFVFAARGALVPADFARDFVAAEAGLAGGVVYTADPESARRHSALLGFGGEPMAGPFYAHPPVAALAVVPLVPLGFRGAVVAWLALSLSAAAVLAAVLTDVVTGGTRSRRVLVIAAVFVAVVLWPPVLYNLEKGQWSLLLAALGALAWRSLSRARPRAAGALVGLSCALKLAPAMLVPYLLLRRRAALGAVVVTFAALGATSVVLGGPAPWRAFLTHAPENVTFWEGWGPNDVSVSAVITRLLIGGPYATPLVHLPLTARALTVVVAIVLLGAATALTRRAPGGLPAPLEGPVFALWGTLVVLLSPLAWLHYGVLLLLPAAQVVGAATDPRLPASAAIRRRLVAAVGGGLVLLSFPKETLLGLALPFPTAPLAAVGVLALPCYGALLLFGAAAVTVHLTTEGPPA